RSEKWFLDKEQTDAVAQELATKWRAQHLAGKLIPSRWGLQAVYIMVDLKIWDLPCQRSLDEAIGDDAVLDGLTLMLYGGVYATGRDTLGKICNRERYLERVNSRLQSSSRIHETVRVALQKASRHTGQG